MLCHVGCTKWMTPPPTCRLHVAGDQQRAVELTPIERELHALKSGLDGKVYAFGVGYIAAPISLVCKAPASREAGGRFAFLRQFSQDFSQGTAAAAPPSPP